MENETRVKLWAFGSNGSGQLGIGHREDVSSPQECKGAFGNSLPQIRQMVCGGNHTVAVFSNKTCLSTGDNSDGRCLITDNTQSSEFVSMTALSDEVGVSTAHVAATWSATVLSDRTTVTRAVGSGSSGELGLGPGITIAQNLTQVQNFPPVGRSIVKMASCMGHVVAVLDNGDVWGWGKGRKGQLGSAAVNKWVPHKIEDVKFPVVDAVCGKDFTCLFGDPQHGQLQMLGPMGNDRFGVLRDAPDSIPGWKQVAASWGSMYVLLETGELIAWGRNDHGQLPRPGLPALEAIAAGSEHCIGLTKEGKVLAWGWGEHGNCGIPPGPDGDVKERWQEVSAPQPAIAVFAGCATSFIVTDASHEDAQPAMGTLR
jgi:protein ATS1